MDDWHTLVLPDDGLLDALVLLKGKHASRDGGVCAMEAVAWLAGEPHSDRPACACPVVSAYVRRLNDCLHADERQQLRAYLPALARSRSTSAVEQRRGYYAADAAVRVFAPLALDARGRTEQAARLRACAPVVDRVTAHNGRDAAVAAADDAAYAADAADAAAYAVADADDAAAVADAYDAAADDAAAAYAAAAAAAAAAADRHVRDAADAAAYAADAVYAADAAAYAADAADAAAYAADARAPVIAQALAVVGELLAIRAEP